MDRRPNAAWVSSPVVWPVVDRRPSPHRENWAARVSLTGCSAGMDRRPSPHRENWAARVSLPAVQPGWIAGRALTGRTGPRGFHYRRFSRDGSPLVSGAGRQHRVDPGAEGAGGGVTRPPSLLARERRVTLSTGCQVGGPGAAPASVRIRSEVRVRARGRASGAGRSREVSCGAPGSSSFRAGREAASGLRTCGL